MQRDPEYPGHAGLYAAAQRSLLDGAVKEPPADDRHDDRGEDAGLDPGRDKAGSTALLVSPSGVVAPAIHLLVPGNEVEATQEVRSVRLTRWKTRH